MDYHLLQFIDLLVFLAVFLCFVDCLSRCSSLLPISLTDSAATAAQLSSGYTDVAWHLAHRFEQANTLALSLSLCLSGLLALSCLTHLLVFAHTRSICTARALSLSLCLSLLVSSAHLSRCNGFFFGSHRVSSAALSSQAELVCCGKHVLSVQCVANRR